MADEGENHPGARPLTVLNNAYEINHMWTADTKSNEEWSSQLWSQFLQLRKEAWKKNQDFNGWPRDTGAPNVSGFIVQLVERRSGIARSPVEVLIFFFQASLRNCKIAITTARIILHLISYPQLTYDLFHMHYSLTYLSREHMNPQLTCSQRQWLHSSVGRASHWYREVTGSSPVEVLNFFSGFFTQL